MTRHSPSVEGSQTPRTGEPAERGAGLVELVTPGIAVGLCPKPGSRSRVVAFVVARAERTAVIDTGVVEQVSGPLTACLNLLDASPADISELCSTHGHADHAGASPDLAALTGARIAFSARDRNIAGYDPGRCLVDDDVVDIGGLVFRVVATPGHTPGSISFFEPNLRLLIAGDAVQGYGFPGRPPVYFSSGREYRRSLSRLMKLDPEIVVTGHPTTTSHGASCVHRGEAVRELLAESVRSSELIREAVVSVGVRGEDDFAARRAEILDRIAAGRRATAAGPDGEPDADTAATIRAEMSDLVAYRHYGRPR